MSWNWLTDLGPAVFEGDLSDLASLSVPIVRPETYGARADGVTNDDIAIRAAIDAAHALGGGIVAFTPGKTYGWSTSAVITAKLKVTLWGYGATIKHLPGLILQAGADVGTFGNYQKCDDLSILGLRLDMNNIERYGGFQIYGTAGVTVKDTYAYDSNLNPSWISYDHFSFVFNRADDLTPCSDVHMYDIYAEDVELVECDNTRGFILSRFVSRNAAGTTAVGWFSTSNGMLLEDYEISHGIIIDARKEGMNITHETGGPSNNSLRRLKIHDIKILKLTSIGGFSALLAIGNTGGAASTGNTYEDFDLVDILLYVDPTLTVTGTATTAIGSPNLTLVSPTTGWQQFMPVSGAGIPNGTTIVSGQGTSTLVMSQNATANAAGVAITGAPTGRPMLYVIPATTQDCRRLGIRNVTAVGNPGNGQWAVDIRQSTDGVIDGLKIRGATLGLNIVAPQDTRFRNIDVEAVTTGYQYTSSRGGNDVEGLGIYGTPPVTPYLVIATAHATDSIRGKRGVVATVASVATLTLHPSADIFTVTGVAAITSIVATGQIGRTVRLIFSGTAGTTGLTAVSNLKIPANFVYTPNDVYELFCDGTNWYAVTPGIVNP